MKTKLLLWVVLFMAITFNGCNQEEEVYNNQEEVPTIVENPDEVVYPEVGINLFAALQKSEQALVRSMEISLQALPANVSQIEISPSGTINPNGEARLAIATGTFTSALLVKAQDLATGQDLANGTIIGNGMLGYASLSIPAYQAASTYPARVIGFFFWGSTNQWELFHFDTQSPNGNGGTTPPPTLVFSLSLLHNGILPAEGITVNVSLTGDFTTSVTDYMYVRAYSPTTAQQISTNLGYFQGTSQKLTSLTIKPNTTTNELTALFQYSLDNGVTWIPFHTTTQLTQTVTPPPGPDPLPHVELPNGTLVAMNDAVNSRGSYTMHWADAIGIDEKYLDIRWNDPDNRTKNSGCNGYYEKPNQSDRGKWRIPNSSIAELIVQAYKQGKFAEKNVYISSGYYWTNINNYYDGGMYTVDRTGYILYSKYHTTRVRCYIGKELFLSL